MDSNSIDMITSPEPIISEPFTVRVYNKDQIFCFRELTLAEEQECQRKGMIWAGVQKQRIEQAIKEEIGTNEVDMSGWSSYGFNYDSFAEHRTELERLCLAIIEPETSTRMFKCVKDLEELFTPEQITSIANRFLLFVNDCDPENVTGEAIEDFVSEVKKNLGTDHISSSVNQASYGLLVASFLYLAGVVADMEEAEEEPPVP